MTKVITLSASFAGRDTHALASALRAVGWAPSGEPLRMQVDFKDAPATETLDEGLRRATRHLRCSFGAPNLLVVDVGNLVTVGREAVRITLPGMVEQLAALPFEVAAFDAIHDVWYSAPGFGDGHVSLGWAAAFKGAGHERLVSRRWLDDGPWQLLRGPADVSLVVFHELDATAEQALAQARPAHARMGITPSGGFLQTGFVFERELAGLYDPATRTMKVVVLGRELDDAELLEWAAARHEHRLAAGKPVETIAFVFPDEAEAHTHAARLRRYGFRVHAIRAGQEISLDP